MTRNRNSMHINGNFISVPISFTEQLEISMVDYDLHSYIPYPAFCFPSSPILEASQANASNSNDSTLPRPETKKVVGKVHKHICGHETLAHLKILLQRNGM